MSYNKLKSILEKYCRVRISKHFVCYPHGTDKVVVVSKTASDRRYLFSVYRDFKKAGIEIKELR